MGASRHGVAFALTLAAAVTPVDASQPDVTQDMRRVVTQIVNDYAAVIVAKQRQASAREDALLAELTAKDRRLRAELQTRAATQAQLDAVAADREHLVDEIAQHDRRFAAEIGEYRRQVLLIANSSDPAKRAALARYADGDRVGAIRALDDLEEATERAAAKAFAAERRATAMLALDAYDRGELPLADVIARFDKAQGLDPENVEGWLRLSRLYREAGRFVDARRAASEAEAHAHEDWERIDAFDAIADLLLDSGDLAGARTRFEESVKIAKRFAAENPTVPAAQRLLLMTLQQTGMAFRAAGDPVGARANFEQSLDIARRQAAEAKDEAHRATAQRDVSVVLRTLGDASLEARDVDGARRYFTESLDLDRRALQAHPDSAIAKHDVSASLDGMTTVLLDVKDFAAARKTAQESVDRLQQLAGPDRANTAGRRELAAGLINLGIVLEEIGDQTAATAQYTKALEIDRELYKADPTRAGAVDDYAIALIRAGDALAAVKDYAAARPLLEESVAVRRAVADTHRENLAAQRALSASLLRFGAILVSTGDESGARRAFEESARIRRALATANQNSVAAWHDLFTALSRLVALPNGNSYLEETAAAGKEIRRRGTLTRQELDALAVIHLRLLKQPGGEKDIDDATTLLVELRSTPGLSSNEAAVARDLAHNLVDALVAAGDALVDKKDLRAARSRFETALAMTDKLAASSANSAVDRHVMLAIRLRLAEVLLGLPDLASARTDIDAAVTGAKQLAGSEPARADLQRDLAVAYNKAGDLERLDRRPREAIAAYEASAAIFETLGARDPAKVENQWDLLEQRFRITQLSDDPSALAAVIRTYEELGGAAKRRFDVPWIDELEAIAKRRR